MRTLRFLVGSLVLGLAAPVAAQVRTSHATNAAAKWSDTQNESDDDDEIIDLRERAEEKEREEVKAQASAGRAAGWTMAVGGAAAMGLGVYLVATATESKEGYAEPKQDRGKMWGGGILASLGTGLLIWGLMKLQTTSVAEEVAEAELGASTSLPKPTVGCWADACMGGFQWLF